MGTAIEGKSQVAAVQGTEGVPLSPDSWATTRQISSFDTLTVFNVKSYPYLAKGTGTGDDSVAIQAAINDAEANGGVVYLPPGSYPLTTQGLTVSSGGVTILGAGQRATFLTLPNVGRTAITIQAVGVADGAPYTSYPVSATVRDLSIVGVNNGMSVGIFVHQFFMPRITNVDIYNTAVGIELRQVALPFLSSIYMTTGAVGTTYGFMLNGSPPGLNSSYFNSCIAQNFTYNWWAGAGILADIYLTNCEGDNSTYGMFFDGSGGFSKLDIHISGFVADTTTYGIYLYNCNGTNTTIDLSSVWYTSSTTGSGITVDNSNNVSIRGAQMYGSNNAIQFINGSSACTVSDSLFTGSWSSVIAIDASCSHIALTGNVFTKASGTLLASSGTDISVLNNVGVANRLPSSTPTADPHVFGELWCDTSNGNILKMSQG